MGEAMRFYVKAMLAWKAYGPLVIPGYVSINMKKLLLIVISILFVISTILYVGITNELIVVGNEYGQGVKYNDEIKEKLIAQLKERNIKHIINEEGFITFRKKMKKWSKKSLSNSW